MAGGTDERLRPTVARMIVATVVVVLTVVLVWKVIDYRTRPPPPKAGIGAGVSGG